MLGINSKHMLLCFLNKINAKSFVGCRLNEKAKIAEISDGLFEI